MRIRASAFLLWLIVVIGSIVTARVVVVIIGQGDEPDSHQYSVAFSQILPILTTNRASWGDPGWQAALKARLAPLHIDVRLADGAGQLIYSSRSDLSGTNPLQQIRLIDNGQSSATIEFYGAPFVWMPYAVTYIAVQTITLLGVWLLIGRAVLKPLAAMSQAARQVATGSLDFELPESSAREVAEVAQAFLEMRDGLRAALTRQAELEQERRFFIGAIAHDLRSPLFALRGYLEGLERGVAATPEKMAHYVAVCQEKADALEHLIADLFTYSRLEYLEQSPHREPFDFAQLMARAVNGIQIRAQAKVLSVSLDGEACFIEGDRALLGRVLDNLLDNALRYTPAHGLIRLWWRPDGETLRFGVVDSGVGIAAKDLPHLFEPLYRGEPSRSRDTGGVGLGLTIAKRILQAHHGDLSAGNASEGGAAFTGVFVANPVCRPSG